MRARFRRISTNVRFLALTVAAAGATACATGPSTLTTTTRGTCAADELLVCAPFGPERRCTCTAHADLGVLRDAWRSGDPWRRGLAP